MQDHMLLYPARFIRRINLGISLALLPFTSMASSEVYPGAFAVAPPGTQALSLYLYERKYEGFYIDGKRFGDSELKAHATVLAYTNFGQTAGMPSSWNIALPDIHVRKTSGSLPYGFGDTTNGLGDVRLGYTFWPVNDTESGRSLAIASTLQIPSADYDNSQSLNAGDNRWRATLQLGWIQKLSSTLTFDFVPEVSFYSPNHNFVGFGMTQKPTYAATTYLRWRFMPIWEANVGFQANRGGAQNINGYVLDNERRQQRVFLGLSTALSKNIFTGLRYSHDTSIGYELKTTSDLVLNFHYVF